MAALNLCFLFGVGVGGFLVFATLWMGILFLLRVKHTRGYRWLSVPAYVMLIGSYVFYATRPAVVWADEFGFPPPADVGAIRGAADENVVRCAG